MNNIIEIRNLSYKIRNKQILNNINIFIKEKDFISIIGPNNSGKTALIKSIVGLNKYNGEILYNNEPTENSKSKIRKDTSIVFDNPETAFIMDTVYNDLVFTCKNKKIKDYKNIIETISEKLDIKEIWHKAPNELSGGQKQKVALANALITQSKILILDNALTMIDNISKSNIYAYLQELNQKKNMTIINVVNDTEETLYSNRLILIHNGRIVLDDTTKNAYQNEDLFIKLKIKIPFIIELSNKLKLYNLVEKTYYSNEELINKLW